MSTLIKRSVGQLKCEVVGYHDISLDDEDKLYIKPSRELITSCMRCGAKLRLKMNETKEDEYFEEEL